MGEVITFYSFKGGVGRTMGLANVAALYAQNGKRVLALDFDFEAPGLHKYFLKPRDGSKTPELRDGVLNYLQVVQRELEREYPAGEGFDTLDVRHTLPQKLARWLDAGNYIYEITVKDPNRKGATPEPIHFIPAVRFDATYPDLVRNFDWRRFYELYWEVFPVLARTLANRYDVVLIDSRTGVTDLGSICTILLPDKLVLAFSPNEQSLPGALEAGWQAIQGRDSMGRPPLHVYPLLSRLEDGEETLKREWIARAQKGFERLFEAAYKYVDCDLETYFNAVRVPHRPYYAYGERIAAEEQRTSETGSLAEVYHQFTRCLSCDGVLAAQDELKKSGYSQDDAWLRSMVGQMNRGPFADPAKVQAFEPIVAIENAANEARQGRHDDALRTCDETIAQLRPNNDRQSRIALSFALFRKQEVLRAQKRMDETIGPLHEIITLFAQYRDDALVELVLRAHLAMVGIHEQRGATSQALAEVEAAINLAQQHASNELGDLWVNALAKKSNLLAADKQWDHALACLEQLIEKLKHSPTLDAARVLCDTMLNQAVALDQLKRSQEATEIRAELIRRHGDSADEKIRQLVGVALYHRGKEFDHQPEERLRLLDDVLQRLEKVDKPLEHYKAVALTNKASYLEEVGQYAQSQQAGEEWLRQFRSSENEQIRDMKVEVLVNLSLSCWRHAKEYIQQGDQDAANALLEQAHTRIFEALQTAPENIFVLENAAYVLALQNRLDEARVHLQRALSIDAETVRSGALEDIASHPVPQDEVFRNLLDELAPPAGDTQDA